MKSICAWCGSDLRGPRAGCKGGISYGICLPCATGILNNTPGLIKGYIDRIDSAVAVLTGDGVVLTANRLACTLLQKDLAQIEGVGCGEVFGCAAPGNCGNCLECAGCTGCEIRRSVVQTHRTGKGVTRMAPHLGQLAPLATEDVWWVISTSKFLDCVVLRLSGKTVRKKTGRACREGGGERMKQSGAGRGAPGHPSLQREKRGTSTPSERTVSQNIPSGLTQSAPSP